MHKEYVFCPFCSLRLQTRLEEDKERKFCPGCNWTYYPTPAIAVAAVITKLVDNELCVLMVKRKREPFKYTWMFPAGFLDQGEHPETDTLPREVAEEVGLTVTRSFLIKIAKSISDPRSPDHLVLFYGVQTEGNIANNDTDENSDIKWFSITDTVNIGFPHHREFFEELKENYSRADVYI